MKDYILFALLFVHEYEPLDIPEVLLLLNIKHICAHLLLSIVTLQSRLTYECLFFP